MGSQEEPHRLVLAWESLPGRVQAAIAFPPLVVVLFVVHVTLLNQPLVRGLVYALFWGVLATYAIVAATRNEAAKRRGGGGDRP